MNDLEASKRFYDAVFAVMGVDAGAPGKERYYCRSSTGTPGIIKPINGQPATCANGGTIGLTFTAAAGVDAFHAAGVANGGTTCEDPPSMRNRPSGKMYSAFLRDPDGTKFCAVYRLP